MAGKRLRIALALATAAFVSMPQVAAGTELASGRRTAPGRHIRARARALRGRTNVRAGVRLLRAEARRTRTRTPAAAGGGGGDDIVIVD